MSFNRRNMARVASASTGAQANWLYRTTDTLIDVLVDGYFNSSFTSFKVDDLVQVKAIDDYYFIRVLESNNKVVDVEHVTLDKRLRLSSSSFDIQEPTALDDPIQINFGPAEQASDNSVTLDADGTMTFHVKDSYAITGLFEFNRQSSGNVTLTFIRGVLNGNQVGNSVAIQSNTSDQTQPFQFNFEADFQKDDVFTLELVRDSAGFNDGELRPQSSSIGWNDSPSTSIRIFR